MQLGPYEITGEVGRGGMGTVLKGRAPDGRTVAIKLLLKPGARDALERFRREGRLQGALGEAEGFVPLLDAGVGPRGPYLVLPFLEGGTLRSKLQRGPLPIADALLIARTLAAAIGRAHARGVVHRDLKPENVLFTGDGRPLIADLGLAKHFDPEAAAGMSVQLSKTGEMRGTIGYAAPEQLRDAKNAGPPADVFALGAIFYECLAGRAPFEGQTITECFALTLGGDIEPLKKLRSDAPPGFVAVIDRALLRDVAKRFADGAALAEALAAADAAPGRSSSAWRAPLALGGALGAVALAAALVVATRSDDAARAPTPTPAPPAQIEPVVAPTPAANTPPPEYPVETRGWRRTAVLGSPAWKVHEGVHVAAPLRERARALLGLEDGTVQMFDLMRGEVLWTLPAGAPVYTTSVSSDDTLGASGSTSGDVVVWDLVGAREARRLPMGSSVSRVAFAPNGRHLAVSCADGSLRVLDLSREGHVTLNVRPHEEAAGGLAWSPDGQLLFAGGRDGRLRALWAGTGELAGEVAAHEGYTMALVHATEAPRLVSGAWDGTLVVWDLVREASAVRFDVARRLTGHKEHVRAVTISADGRRVASGGADSFLRVWDVADGREVAAFEGQRFVSSVVLSNDGERVWGSGWDGRLRSWDVARGASLDVVAGHGGPVNGLALLPGGQAASGGYDGTLRVWDLAAGSEVRQMTHLGGNVSFAVSADGRRAASGSSEGEAAVFDPQGGAELMRTPVRPGWMLSVALSADGDILACGYGDGFLRLWRVGAAQVDPLVFETQQGAVRALAFVGVDGIVSGGADGSVKVWDLGGMSGNGVLQPSGGPQILALARAANGRLVVADEAGAITVRLPTGEVLSRFGHDRAVRAVAVTPDARVVASAGDDGTVRLWDVATSAERDRLDLAPRQERPRSVALSPDGRELLIGTGRGVILRYVAR